jgi:transposase
MTKAPHIKIVYINQEINKAVLFVAFELSNKKWKLGFSDGTRNRVRDVDAGDMDAVVEEIQLARVKLGLEEDAQVHSCYEAGRDGFWIHRWLTDIGVVNYIIDSASIEVSQKKRKAKTDKIDVGKMVRLLVRYVRGEKDAFSILEVPGEEAEDDRRLHRERGRLVIERGSHTSRVSSLLVLHNIRDIPLNKDFGYAIEEALSWDGKPLGKDLMDELRREFVRYKCIDDQIKFLEKQQKDRTAAAEEGALMKVKAMMMLKGIGWQSSWILVMELFGWRTFDNRRSLGSFAGLTGTPFASGDSNIEQGISKAGNKRVRHLMVELAWMWIRYQPQSDLAQWFESRFANGGKRMRRVGIVAVARKLLIALWHFVEDGVIPKGANLKAA